MTKTHVDRFQIHFVAILQKIVSSSSVGSSGFSPSVSSSPSISQSDQIIMFSAKPILIIFFSSCNSARNDPQLHFIYEIILQRTEECKIRTCSSLTFFLLLLYQTPSSTNNSTARQISSIFKFLLGTHNLLPGPRFLFSKITVEKVFGYPSAAASWTN